MPRSHNIMLLLPVLAIFSATFFMSFGDRNCPFLTLMGNPVLPAAINRSVCLQRKAGICITSTTDLTASACHGSCISVITGTSNVYLISSRIRKPSSMPTPRFPAALLRLALSKLLLKIRGMSRSLQICLIESAMPCA